MKKVEKYNSGKTYMFPSGALATPEVVAEKYPATAVFTHIVETDEAGEVMFSLQNLSAMRGIYKIDPALSETEAIAAIEAAMNAPPPVQEPSAEERTAAALELLALTSMPDTAV